MTTITIDRAVVEQALEALESCREGDYSSPHVIHPSFDADSVSKAETALRAALMSVPDGAEQQSDDLHLEARLVLKEIEHYQKNYAPTPYIDDLLSQVTGCIVHLQAALAEQPAQPQEPVAYVCPSSHVTADGSMEDGSDYLEWADEASDYEKRVGTPLYTAPQPAKPAERVPLTDEEIKYATLEAANHLIDHIYEYGVNSEGVSHRIYKFARAIEAKILEQFK